MSTDIRPIEEGTYICSSCGNEVKRGLMSMADHMFDKCITIMEQRPELPSSIVGRKGYDLLKKALPHT